MTSNILIVPVTYRRPGRRDIFDIGHGDIGEHYPEMIAPQALEAELFGGVTDGPDSGPGHLKHYLEQLMEGTVEIQGTVSDWAYVDNFAPMDPDIDKCGLELFHYEPYPVDHPDYDPSKPWARRRVSPVLEDALLAIGVDTVDAYDTLGLVTACNETVMRGVAASYGVEIFGKRVKLAVSSHPFYSNVLEYWNFPDALAVGNVSRNMIHEVLHTWDIGHAQATDCGENTFGAACEYVRYGSPYSVMGDPVGIFSLDIMDRIKLGVLTEDNLVHITEGGTYTLSGLNDTSATHRGAYLYWPGTNIPRLAVQFRTGQGYDAAITDHWLGFVSQGLTVHVNAISSQNVTDIHHGEQNWYLVDPNPSSSSPMRPTIGSPSLPTPFTIPTRAFTSKSSRSPRMPSSFRWGSARQSTKSDSRVSDDESPVNRKTWALVDNGR